MKLLNTFAFVTISLLAGCGGSSSNPAGGGVDSGTGFDGGGATTVPVDGSTTPTDAASDTDAAPGCTQGSCASGQVCCQGTTGSTCIAEGATCKGLAAQCTNTATCSAATAGQVCCGTLSIASQSATSVCQAGPCPSGEYELCTQSTECTGGQTCQPIVLDGFSLPIASCQDAVDGGGSDDSGTSITDASADGPG